MHLIAKRLNSALSRLVAFRRAPVAALVALLTLGAFLPGFTGLPPVNRDEARFAQATRQMMITGDYVDIHFQNRHRYKKPIGIYWLQSAAVAATGGTGSQTIWNYRLPSLIAAVLAAALTARIAAVFGGATAGLTAGLMMAGVFLLGAEAHLAKTDAALLAAILAAQLALARLYRDARAARFVRAEIPPLGPGAFVLFWAGLSASVLLKGPIGPAVLGMTVAALALWHRRLGWLRALRPGRGFLLVAVLVLPWFIAITMKSGMGFWDAALGHDLLKKVEGAQENHGAPPGSYLAMLWITFQPAAIALALALPAIWRTRRNAGVIFALCWAVPAWLIFEAAPTKLMHYVLPLYPALAVMIALTWSETVAAPLRRWRRVAFWGLGAVPVLLILAAAGFAVSWGAWPVLPVLLALLAVGLGLWLAHSALSQRLPLAAALGLWLVGVGLIAGIFPVAARIPALWPAERIVALIPPDPACKSITVYEHGFDEASLVFLAPGEVQAVPSAEAATKLAADRCAAAVVPDTDAGVVTAAGGIWRGRVRGLDLGSGQKVDLAVFSAAQAKTK